MPDLGLTSLLYSARPAISIDGEDRADLRDALMSLIVEETADGLFRAEAVFGAWGTSGGEVGLLFTGRELLDFGREIEIEMGEGELARRVFRGRITALEARYPAERAPQFAVLAEDGLQDLRMTRRSRVFEDVNDASILASIAENHGLTPEIDVDGPQHRAVAQLNLSDLAFLRERARAVDAEIWLEDGTLRVQARARRSGATVELTYGQGLHEFSVIADLAHQRSRVAVGGWDIAAAEAIEESAGADALGSEAGAGETGPSLLQQTLGACEERIVHLAVGSRDEARVAAEAHMRRISRRFVTGQAKAEGDPRLRVGAMARLRGLGHLFDGDYYVCETRHEFDDTGGFRTCFAVERAGLGG
jgi:phage protein D